MNCTPGKKLLRGLIFFMTLTMVVEIGLGYYTNSKTLLVEAFHSLSDLCTVILVIVSFRISSRHWERSTFGFARAEVVGTFVNCVFFAGSCLTIAISCIGHFIERTPIRRPILLLYMGSYGLAFNFIELMIFHLFHSNQNTTFGDEVGHSHNHISQWLPEETENEISFVHLGCKSFFFVIMHDALGSLTLVIIGTALFIFESQPDIYYLDPICALLLIITILYTIWPIFKESGYILMQWVPFNIQIQDLERRLLAEVPEIESIHELHIWQLVGNTVIATIHIRCRSLKKYLHIEKKVKEFFISEGIYETTIQPEFKDPCPRKKMADDELVEDECLLVCPDWDQSCLLRSCCGQLNHPELFQD